MSGVNAGNIIAIGKAKTILVVVVVILVLGGIGAAMGGNSDNSSTPTISQTGNGESTATQTVKPTSTSDPTPTVKPTSTSSPTPTVKPTNVGWKEVLRDYEAWVDEYVALMKKYMANPLDSTLLSDYSAMMIKLSEWEEKLEDVQDDLSIADLAEWTAAYMRITQKMSNIY